MLERATVTQVARTSAFGDWTGAELKGLALAEKRGLAVVELAAFGRGDAARAGLSDTLGLPLPAPGMSAEHGGIAALSVGPGRWLLIGGEAAVSSLPTPDESLAAITDLSAGRSVLSLTGPNAARILMKATGVDLSPATFPPGRVAATALARMPVVIWRSASAYELIVPRSYAVSLRDWLIVAGEAG